MVRRKRRSDVGEPVDLTTTVGSITFPNPVMTASGTAGHGAELARYIDFSKIGAVVIKSLSIDPWPGNPPPRVHETAAGMINSVGLQGPGVQAWLDKELPQLEVAGARVVASIWGRTVDEYKQAAAVLSTASEVVVAVEVNLSCPNLGGSHQMFSQSARDTSAAIEASLACDRPVWAKLTSNVTDLVSIAAAARGAGAEAVTLINTVPGLTIDPETRRKRLGGGGGGLSGPAIHPIAVRAVFDVRAEIADLPIIGVGGVSTAEDAIELMLAGANAVQVGTATFLNPRSVALVCDGVEAWCRDHQVRAISDLIGEAHDD